VESVAQNDMRADVADFIGRQRFDRAIGADRHEGRRLYFAMGQFECAASGGTILINEGKLHKTY